MSESTMVTERLVLRPANNEEDLDTFKRMLSPDEFYFQFGYEYNEGMLEGYNFTRFGVVCYSAFLKDSGEYIGYVGIKPDYDKPEIGELEYFIAKDFRNKGYCHEAAVALIDAFKDGSLTGTKGEGLIAETISENTASARVLEKLGFDLVHHSLVLELVPDAENPKECVTFGKDVSAYALDLRTRDTLTHVFDFHELPRKDEALAYA